MSILRSIRRRPPVDWYERALDLALDLREIERRMQKRDPKFSFESLERWEAAMATVQERWA